MPGPVGATVLVVEDAGFLREAMAEFLRDEGYDVCTAATGTEALEVLGATPRINVITLDTSMPDMNGVTFFTELRSRRLACYPAVIAVTAPEGVDGELDPSSYTARLEKPVHPLLLLEAIESSAFGRETGYWTPSDAQTPRRSLSHTWGSFAFRIQHRGQERTREEMRKVAFSPWQTGDLFEGRGEIALPSTEKRLKPMGDPNGQAGSDETDLLSQPRKRRVLIVEDDHNTIEVSRVLLQHGGYIVETARDGAEALHRLDEIDRPAVILLDLFMPVMDGKEFLQRLRNHPDRLRAEIPVVIISSAPEEVVGEVRGMATDVLRKPVPFEKIVETVSRYCDHFAERSPVAAARK